MEPSSFFRCVPLVALQPHDRMMVIRQPQHDQVLIEALRKAHSMLAIANDGMPTLDMAPASPYERRLMKLAFLAPQIQRNILDGRQPANLTLERLIHQGFPVSWRDQILGKYADGKRHHC